MPKDIVIRFLGDTTHLDRSSLRVSQTLEGGLGKLAAAGAVVGGVVVGAGIALGALGLKAVQASAAMEQSRVAFTTMLGSAQAANSFIRDLQKFAANTPFEFVGLQASAKQLLAFGFNAKSVIPTMTAIGDAVSALGGGQPMIDRVTLSLGQMMAKGRVQSDEMLQLAEAGIPAWDFLAKKLGVDIPHAMKLVEKGAVSAKVGIDAITTGMEQRFGGMMAQQSSSIAGMWSNVQDSVGQTLVVIGDLITKAFDLKGKVAGLQELLAAFQGFAAAIQQGQAPMSALVDMLERLGFSSSQLVAIENILLPLLETARSGFQQLGEGIAVVGPIVQQAAQVLWTQLQPALVVIAQHSDFLKANLFAVAIAIGVVIAAVVLIVASFVMLAAAAFSAWDAISSAVRIAIPAVGQFVSAVASMVQNVIGWFQGLAGRIQGAVGNLGNLLYGAGQAVINGFLDGLKSKLGEVASTASSIGNLIAQNKGPLDYDRRLLVPHGRAIMAGLNEGMLQGLGPVLGTAGATARSISLTVNGATLQPLDEARLMSMLRDHELLHA
jgi:tape measure domain-containing protein